ncbi:MAG: protein kinase, partial [Myxococcota bacterium]|nr:protein kinase [Myxococcota bacterium]
RVAIKFIDQEYADSLEAQSRFVNEARAAATIHSKHAIQIFDHGVADDGRPYIVMELLLGEPLDRRLDRFGRISLPDTARILGQVCRALQRAHDAGIIHRDLKPENIFLVRSPDDDDEIAKVLDFGIAKMKGPPGGEGLGSSTKTGALLGTPYFMSPEQARGLRTIDHRSDLWSLGVIAYRCVTGVLPFDGESVGDLLVKICTSAPPTPSLALPGLPPAFDAWFARTLAREPMNRFGSASELADELLLSAGLSARRGVTPNFSDRQTSFDLPLTAAGPPVAPTVMTPLRGAGETSAPFTAPSSIPGLPRATGRGVLFAIVAALVGGSVGVGTVVKLLAPPSGQPATTSTASSSSPTPATPRAPGVLAATAPPLPSPSVPATAGAPRPMGSPSANTALHPAFHAPPLSSARGVAPIIPTPKPPQKPSPASADPGY